MKVFISYPREQRKLAEALVNELRKRGLSVWYDEDGLHAGDQWISTTAEALKTADNYVLLIGPRASKPQREEWQVALDASWTDPAKRVIPVLLPRAELPPFLRERVVIRLGTGRSSLEETVDTLAAVLENQVDLIQRGEVIKTTDQDRRRQRERLASIERAAESFEVES
jgi:hypothetical protein